MRIDNYYLNIAKAVAARSTCLRRQYGAVHAEQNAIISAPRRSMRGATLYLACLDETIDPAPCNICDRMIKNAGITRVVTRAGTF